MKTSGGYTSRVYIYTTLFLHVSNSYFPPPMKSTEFQRTATLDESDPGGSFLCATRDMEIATTYTRINASTLDYPF